MLLLENVQNGFADDLTTKSLKKNNINKAIPSS